MPVFLAICASSGSGVASDEEVADLKARVDQRDLERQAEAEKQVIKQETRRRQLEAEAKMGNADAQWELGTSDHTASSWKWLCRSADHGHERARLEVARQFWYGIVPTPEDRVRGYMWYRLAAKHGSARGKIEASERQADLTADQISQAERMLEDWQRGECESTVRLVLSGHGEGSSIADTSWSRNCTDPTFAGLPECRACLNPA